MGIEKRGFASLSPEKRREIAAKGGLKAQSLGTAHRWTKEQAQAAGKAGGLSKGARARARAEENQQRASEVQG